MRIKSRERKKKTNNWETSGVVGRGEEDSTVEAEH
jgi:hypothetical protein